MAIRSPSEPVYYYECSGGEFRLVYFIPPEELSRLRDQNRILQRALEDFPDGVDLGCTEPDFDEFERLYEYRPDVGPEALRQAFFALFSATHDWKRFLGSGFLPKSDLERHVEPVRQVLRGRKTALKGAEPPPHHLTLEQRRQRMDRRAVQQAEMYEVLEQMPVEGIDPARTLRDQKFSTIEMGEGTSAEEAFAKLHQKRKK